MTNCEIRNSQFDPAKRDNFSQHMTTDRHIFKNFVSLAVAEGLSRTIGLASTVYLARTLGAEGFGIIGFAFAVVSYFTLIVKLGFDTLGIRELARDRTQIHKYITNIIAIRFLLAIAAYIVLVAFVLLVNRPVGVKNFLLFLGLVVFTSAFNLSWVFQGIERMEIKGIACVLESLFYMLGVVIFVRTAEQIYLVAFFFILASVFAFLFMSAFLTRTFGFFRLCIDVRWWKDLLRQVAPIGISLFMIQIYYYVDTIMLGFMRSEVEVGYYVGAYKLMLVSLIPAGLILKVFFPSLSRKDDVHLPDFARNYVKMMFFTGIPIAIGGILFARELIYLFYGAQYEQAILPFTILMINPLFVFANMAFGNPLIAWDKQRVYMRWITLGAVLNVILNLVLIPFYGMIGAAVATVLTEAAILRGLHYEFQKNVAVSLFDVATRPIVWVAVMSCAVFGLRHFISPEYFVVTLILSSLVYVIGMLLSDSLLMKNFLLIFKSS